MILKKSLMATTALIISLQPAMAGQISAPQPIHLAQSADAAEILNSALAELQAAKSALADATEKGEGVDAAQAAVDTAQANVDAAQAALDAAQQAEQPAEEAPEAEEAEPVADEAPDVEEPKAEEAEPAAEEAPETEETAPEAKEAEPLVEEAPEAEAPEAEEAQPTADEAPKAEESEPVAEEAPEAEEIEAEEAPATEEPKAEKSEATGEEPAAKETTESEEAPEAEAQEAEDTEPAAEEAPEAEKPEASETEVPSNEEAVDTVEEPAAEPTKAEEQPAAEEDVAPPTEEVKVKEPELEVEPVAKQIEEATEKPITVLPEEVTEEDKAALAAAEEKRRKDARKRRNELIGAAAAGVAVGVLAPLLGGKLVEDQGDRVVIERNGEYFIRKDENALLRRNGVRVDYEELDNGLSRETMTRPNGVQIVTTRAPNGDILRRERVFPNGDVTVLIDSLDQRGRERIDYDRELPPLDLTIDRGLYIVSAQEADRGTIRTTFEAPPVETVRQAYSLRDVRSSERLRESVRRLDLDAVQFDSGSSTVRQSEVGKLEDIALAIADVINEDSSAVFLIEGHTDAVGGDVYNLALSDRRAETIARILIDSYGLPPENFVVEGYGEAYLKVDTQGDEVRNRRVAIRNITPLLASQN